MNRFWQTAEWQAFREQVLEADGYYCRGCSRVQSRSVVLQVHHKQYIPGRKPWEYGPEDVETLCRGCHGWRHRFWPPIAGWTEDEEEEDLEDLIGECELCGNSIRYVHFLYHPDWGYLEVGSGCAETLGQRHPPTPEALREMRRERFMKSRRWRVVEGAMKLHYFGFDVLIEPCRGRYFLGMNGMTGIKHSFPDVQAAKEKAFQLITDGRAEERLAVLGVQYVPPPPPRRRRKASQPSPVADP